MQPNELTELEQLLALLNNKRGEKDAGKFDEGYWYHWRQHFALKKLVEEKIKTLKAIHTT